jgi:hypothetical protein
MEGETMDLQKLKAVWDWPLPKERHELRSFLDQWTYYLRFKAAFVDITK